MEFTKVKDKEEWTAPGGYRIKTGERFAPGTGMSVKKKMHHCYHDDKYIAQEYELADAKKACTNHKIDNEKTDAEG